MQKTRMSYMKRNRILALAAALAAVFSCDEIPQDIQQDVSFRLGTSSITLDYNGGTREIAFTAPGEWTASSSDTSWCSVSPSFGSGSDTIVVKVSPLPDEDLDRSARIKVSCNGLNLSVSVKQTCNPDYFAISPTQISLGGAESDFEITVVSHSQEYEITIVDEWITEVSRSGEPLTGETISFHATSNKNAEAAPRSGVVSVCTKDGNCIPVMVEQASLIEGNVLAMRFTATWCGYCPYMDEAFKKVAEQRDDFRFVTFHASSGYPLYFKDCEPLATAYKIEGFPTGILAGWRTINNNTNTDNVAKTIIKYLDDFQSKFPCTVSIEASAAINNGSIEVNAKVNSLADNSLQVVALVLESGIVQAQNYYPQSGGSQTISDFVHDNVARKLISSSITGGEAFSLGTGESKDFSWSCALDSSWNSDNLSVLVWVYSAYGDLAEYKLKKSFPDTYIANCTIVPVQ